MSFITSSTFAGQQFLQIYQIVFQAGMIYLNFSNCSSSQRQHKVEKDKRK